MNDDEQVDILLDITSPSIAADEAVQLVSKLCAGLILVWYAVTELYGEARKFSVLRKAIKR